MEAFLWYQEAVMERHPRILYYLPDDNQHSLRRNLALIKQVNNVLPNARQLVVTEPLGEQVHDLADGVDVIFLAASTQKLAAGLSIKQIQAYRERQLLDIIFKFQPHLFLVDRIASGLRGELVPSLRFLKAWSPQTKIVYGMPDIGSTPHRIEADWKQNGVNRLLDDLYDRIFFYGQRDIFDPIMTYKMPVSTAVKVVECGYLYDGDGRTDLLRGQRTLSVQKDDGKYGILIIIDSDDTLDSLGSQWVQTVPQQINGLPVQLTILLDRQIAQPKMQAFLSQLGQFSSGVVDFFDSASCHQYVNSADLVICHASYNAVCNVIARNKQALFLMGPGTLPEYVARAQMLAKAGLAEVCDVSEVREKWLTNALANYGRYYTAMPSVKSLQTSGVHRATQAIASMLQ